MCSLSPHSDRHGEQHHALECQSDSPLRAELLSMPTSFDDGAKCVGKSAAVRTNECKDDIEGQRTAERHEGNKGFDKGSLSTRHSPS